MDLRLYFAVIWRFRFVVLVGALLAVALMVLSLARVSFANGRPHLAYRQSEGWTSQSTLWVTQAGFPLGRAVYDKFFKGGTAAAPTIVPQFSEPTRFASLATVYTSLVSSDAVYDIVRRSGPLRGSLVGTQPTLPGNSSLTLPFVHIAGTARNPGDAVAITRRGTAALIEYVKEQQRVNRIPPEKRIVLQVIQRPEGAALTKPRKLTQPIVVLIATLMATIGLTFLLENLRPRARLIELGTPKAPTDAAAARRSA